MPQRVIWVLKGVRAGDTAQALALAERLGGQIVEKQLAFNALTHVPNWLLGPRLSHLLPEVRQRLNPPWPDLVIATGRRTAPVAAWLRKASQGKSKTVQIGRPRMALSAFDLVVTTPQYGAAKASNCIELPAPIPRRMAIDGAVSPWAGLPRPWTLAVLGGGKYPQILGAREIAGFAASLNGHVGQHGGSVILLDAPRTNMTDFQSLARLLAVSHWRAESRAPTNLYLNALQQCDVLAVTGDSVSIASDMLATGKPVWVYPLPRSRLALGWKADAGWKAGLSRRGILQPPRDVAGFFRVLIESGVAGNLATGKAPTTKLDIDRMLDALAVRINGL